ncbi:MAG: hypothetical protein S4CHLAM20_01840 [Chlamydiia bacterium]|nr:hypothetical protein [Chlamydiia bacterium]
MKKVLLIVSCLCVKVFTLSISPVDLEIDFNKGQGYYTLINDANSQKVIAISTKTRSMDIDGKNIMDATKDLIVYPKQVVLKPKEKRLIRVIWKAKKPIAHEKAYRIIFAEQNINVDFGEEDLGKDERRAGLSFGVRFEGTVYIQPKKVAKSKIEVTSFDRKKIEGEDYFVITLENTGSKHKHIISKDLELELLRSAKGKEDWHLLTEELVQKYAGNALLILSKGKREIKIPCTEKEIPDSVLGVRITE